MEEVITGTAETTPAPAPEAEIKTGDVTPQQDSAPDTKVASADSTQGGAGDTKSGKDGLPAGVKKRLWEQSEKIRKMEAELAKFSSQPPTPTPAPAPAPSGTPEAETDMLEDPQKWAKTLENRVLSEAEKRIFSRIEQAETEKRIVAEADKAKDYILSKPEFADEVALTEIQSIITSPEVQAICKTCPLKGAEYAEFLWLRARVWIPPPSLRLTPMRLRLGPSRPLAKPKRAKRYGPPQKLMRILKTSVTPNTARESLRFCLPRKRAE
jgi:hypothetical protein